MKSLKRIVTGAAAAVLMVGCAASVFAWGSKKKGTGRTEITYMAWYNTTQSEAADVQKLIDKFNGSQNRIHVTLITVSRADYETKINTMAAAHQLPDTGAMAESMAIRYAQAGLLANVSDMFPADDKPLDSLAFNYKGTTVGYSSGNEVLLLYYNKKLFDAAGISYPPASADKAWTWDQYVEVARKLTKDRNGKTPNDAGFDADNIVQYGTDFNRLNWMWPVLAYSNGGGIMSPDGKQLWLGKPETAEAMQAIADLYLKEKVAPSVSAKNSMPSLDVTLLTGKVAMATSGQWEIGVSLKNSLKDGLVYGVGVLPKMKKAVTYNTGAPYAVFKTTKHPAEAKEFIKWISSEENAWAQITGGILMPITKKYYSSDKMIRSWADNDVHPDYATYKTAVVDYAMNNAVQVPWYYFPCYDVLQDVIESGIEDVWNGRKTAKQYISDILPQATETFNKYRPN